MHSAIYYRSSCKETFIGAVTPPYTGMCDKNDLGCSGKQQLGHYQQKCPVKAYLNSQQKGYAELGCIYLNYKQAAFRFKVLKRLNLF